jgi:NADH dehydrogenase (ubiquinone) Fe-S protein 1
MNILHSNASQVTSLDLGYTSSLNELKKNKPRILFLLGADDPCIKKEDFSKSFIVYIGNLLKYMSSFTDI